MTYILRQMLTNKKRVVKSSTCLRFQSGLIAHIIEADMSGVTISFDEDPTEFQLFEYRNEVFVAKKDFVLK